MSYICDDIDDGVWLACECVGADEDAEDSDENYVHCELCNGERGRFALFPDGEST